MAVLTIRKLSETTKQKLRVRAAENGRSMEEEARRIIERGVEGASEEEATGLAEAIHCLFAPLGGVDIKLPDRRPRRQPPDFSGPEYDP